MKDAERVESAHRRAGSPPKTRNDHRTSGNGGQKQTPMDTGNINSQS